MFEDWGLIEASFTAQYGIRLRTVDDMTYGEFSTLLTGLGENTPLGQIVSIRKEEDPEVLKNFTPDQHQIRNAWRMKLFEKQNEIINKMDDKEKMEQVRKIQNMFAKAFSK